MPIGCFLSEINRLFVAVAFWTLENVAVKLLRLLPAVKKQHMIRIIAECGSVDW